MINGGRNHRVQVIHGGLLGSLRATLGNVVTIVSREFPCQCVFFFMYVTMPLRAFLDNKGFLQSTGSPSLAISYLGGGSRYILDHLLIICGGAIAKGLPSPTIGRCSKLSNFLRFFRVVTFHVCQRTSSPIRALPTWGLRYVPLRSLVNAAIASGDHVSIAPWSVLRSYSSLHTGNVIGLQSRRTSNLNDVNLGPSNRLVSLVVRLLGNLLSLCSIFFSCISTIGVEEGHYRPGSNPPNGVFRNYYRASRSISIFLRGVVLPFRRDHGPSCTPRPTPSLPKSLSFHEPSSQ